MQTCPECGTRNAAGAEFCSSCGAYLAWEDEQSPPRPGSPAPPPAPETSRRPPPPRPERPAPPQSRPEPLPRPSPPRSGPVPGPGRGPTRHNPQKVRRMPPDPDERDDRTVVLPRIPDDVPGPGHWPSNPSPPDGTERAGSSSTVRGPGPVPPTREPPPVPPGNTRAWAPRPLEGEPERSIAPGEVACPRCGTGNPPERHFCRRCATELRRDAPRPVPPPPTRSRRGRSPMVWVLGVLAALLVLWLLLGLL
jgi:ribosomal protein L40E